MERKKKKRHAARTILIVLAVIPVVLGIGAKIILDRLNVKYPALAYKFTLKRSMKRLQGSIGENDTFGTRQHAPLLDVEIPD